MILEVVRSLKFRGHGIVSQGTRFDSSEKTIPAHIKAEYKSGSGNIILIEDSVSAPPQKQGEVLATEEPQSTKDSVSEVSPSSEPQEDESKTEDNVSSSSEDKEQPPVKKKRTLKRKLK